MSSNSTTQNDPRRVDKIKRFKSSYSLQVADDQLQEYMNIIGMVFSMCGLMMKVISIEIKKSKLFVRLVT